MTNFERFKVGAASCIFSLVLAGCMGPSVISFYGLKIHSSCTEPNDLLALEHEAKHLMMEQVACIKDVYVGWTERQIKFKFGDPTEVLFGSDKEKNDIKCVRYKFANNGKECFVMRSSGDDWIVVRSLSNRLGDRYDSYLVPLLNEKERPSVEELLMWY